LYGAIVTTPEPDEQVRVRAPEPSGSPGSRVPVRGTRTRGTKQAQALAAALQSLPGFCSAQEIHAQLRRKGEHVGLTTVYRHLQALSEQGSIDTIRDANGEILYRQCETSDHHHHLTCRNCGCSVEVEGRAVEQWAERVATEAGFTDVGHTVELFGLCPDCARRPSLS
jgi:Fur family ferric uptake transcriptional regulator